MPSKKSAITRMSMFFFIVFSQLAPLKAMSPFRYAMFALIRDIVPISAEAFIDYRLEGMVLTRLEIEAIQEKRQVGPMLSLCH